MIYFGETLKKLRKEKELTQEVLAEFLGVSFQTVSKWERNESYPDIAMLPVIAAFFGVSTDTLLGVDKAADEAKIQKYIEDYENQWRLGHWSELSGTLKKATVEYPGEFRLLIRYMNSLMNAQSNDRDGALAISSEFQSIYDNIQNYCTDDSIRLWAKRMICSHYKALGKTEEMEKILEEMPLMKNSRDYIATYLYRSPDNAHEPACKNAVSELVYLLDGAIFNLYGLNMAYSAQEQIIALKAMLHVFDSVFPDGDYGKSYLQVIYSNGHLAHWHAEIGDNETAYKYLRTCAELAKKFDAMPQVTEHTSFLVNGMSFDKQMISKSHEESMCGRMKRLINDKYPLSEEFKQDVKFKEIMNIL